MDRQQCHTHIHSNRWDGNETWFECLTVADCSFRAGWCSLYCDSWTCSHWHGFHFTLLERSTHTPATTSRTDWTHTNRLFLPSCCLHTVIAVRSSMDRAKTHQVEYSDTVTLRSIPYKHFSSWHVSAANLVTAIGSTINDTNEVSFPIQWLDNCLKWFCFF